MNSFAFAAAMHSDPRVQAFLRSPEKTVELAVGEGNNYARCYARSLSCGHVSFCDRRICCRSISTCQYLFMNTLGMDQRTSSVDAVVGSGIGAAASVKMTKNDKLHANAASRFDANMLELGRSRPTIPWRVAMSNIQLPIKHPASPSRETLSPTPSPTPSPTQKRDIPDPPSPTPPPPPPPPVVVVVGGWWVVAVGVGIREGWG